MAQARERTPRRGLKGRVRCELDLIAACRDGLGQRLTYAMRSRVIPSPEVTFSMTCQPRSPFVITTKADFCGTEAAANAWNPRPYPPCAITVPAPVSNTCHPHAHELERGSSGTFAI